MKIIEKSKMPDGTLIQLEDWHDKNTKDYNDLYGYVIGVYPVAKNSGRLGWVKSGERFRISISYNKFANYTDEMVLNDFEALKNGEKTLSDLKDHFFNNFKDQFYLGIIDFEPWQPLQRMPAGSLPAAVLWVEFTPKIKNRRLPG
mgnify:CR=1 FL=1